MIVVLIIALVIISVIIGWGQESGSAIQQFFNWMKGIMSGNTTINTT
jgi:hypothetical protein